MKCIELFILIMFCILPSIELLFKLLIYEFILCESYNKSFEIECTISLKIREFKNLYINWITNPIYKKIVINPNSSDTLFITFLSFYIKYSKSIRNFVHNSRILIFYLKKKKYNSATLQLIVQCSEVINWSTYKTAFSLLLVALTLSQFTLYYDFFEVLFSCASLLPKELFLCIEE